MQVVPRVTHAMQAGLLPSHWRTDKHHFCPRESSWPGLYREGRLTADFLARQLLQATMMVERLRLTDPVGGPVPLSSGGRTLGTGSMGLCLFCISGSGDKYWHSAFAASGEAVGEDTAADVTSM